MLRHAMPIWLRSVFVKTSRSRRQSSNPCDDRVAAVELLENRSLLSAVAAANTAPVLQSGNVNLSPIYEDQTTNGGYLVGDIVLGRLTDADVGAVAGIAMTASISGTGAWQYSVNGGSSWTNVGAVSASASLLLRSNDLIRFVPDAKNGTTASFTFRGWDLTSGTTGQKVDTSINGGSSAFSAVQDNANLTVLPMNDAPVLSGANHFTSISAAATDNPGDLVSTLIAGRITDIDTGAVQGIALIGFVSGTGGWQYSLNNGGSWSNLDTAFASSALLLRPTDRLRYVPYGSDATTASVTFHAWDQTSGSAGTRFNTTAAGGGVRTYSSEQATSTIAVSAVTAVNHAPVLTSGTMLLGTFYEDQTTNGGHLVGDILLGRITDSDAGSLTGIAITGFTSGTGTWQFFLSGGSTWSNVGFVSENSSLLLRSSDSVRFVPDGKNGTSATLKFRGWDRTSGVEGAKVDTSVNGDATAFSIGQLTGNMNIMSMNDAPVLSGANDFSTITASDTANSGNLVSTLIAGHVTDVDTVALQGIAVTVFGGGSGGWQYSVDNGTSWTNPDTVFVSSALLLRSTDRLRYVPYGPDATTASITFRAWDQTSGSPGMKINTSNSGRVTAYSSEQATSHITVKALNHAPVLSGNNINLSPIYEDQTTNGGYLVQDMLLGNLTDVDAGALAGVALIGTNNGTGKWQYSKDGGSTWLNVGAISATSALLLRSSDQVRFVPDGKNGTTASLTYRAWDQTSGVAGAKVEATSVGGNTALSIGQITANLVVMSLNDAPVLVGANDFASITEDQTSNIGSRVFALITMKVSDVDMGMVKGIAVIGLNSGNGKWQYMLDQAQTWIDVGIVSNASALLLRTADRLRFLPNSVSATTATLSFRAWDQTMGSAGAKFNIKATGQTTAFSVAHATSSIIVTGVNDAPVLSGANNLIGLTKSDTTNSGNLVSALIAGKVTDVDPDALKGIAVVGLNSGNGKWQYSVNQGQNWIDVGTVNNSSALLLRPTDRLRFVPNGIAATTASVSFRAWDQTAGSTGAKVNIAAAGLTTPFSGGIATSKVTVT